MKVVIAVTALLGFFSSFAQAARIGTADRASYIVTLKLSLNDQELETCMENICELSGDRSNMECEIVSKRARIVAAGLSNAAVKKVSLLECVKSLRAERFDFEPRPRVGRSN